MSMGGFGLINKEAGRKPCLPFHAPTGPNPHAPLQELNITIKKKLHFPRMFGARQLDEQGVSQDVSDCCRWGVPTGCCAYLTLRAHRCGSLAADYCAPRPLATDCPELQLPQVLPA